MIDTTQNNIVVFEYVGYSSILLMLFYLQKKYCVKYYKANPALENSRFFKRLLLEGRLEKIVNRGFDLEKIYLPHRLALKDIEENYDALAKRSKSIALMTKLLNSEMVDLVYKKAMVENLYNFYLIRFYINNLVCHASIKTRVVFIPGRSVRMVRLAKTTEANFCLDKQVQVPFWAGLFLNIVSAAVKIKFAAGFFLWMLSQTKKITTEIEPLRKYQLGIRIYGSDFGFMFKHRSMDFLLDGSDLRVDNCLFCIEDVISKDYLKEFKERTYNFVEIPKILEKISWQFVRRVLLKVFMHYWSWIIVTCLIEPEFVLISSIRILRDYIWWSRFLELYHIKNYVAYNNFGIDHIVRNILFDQKGIRTWYYPHTCNDTGIFAPRNCTGLNDFNFSYLFFDSFVSWGNRMKEYYSSHRTFVKNYKDIGSLWSEHVLVAAKSNVMADFKNRIAKKIGREPNKIIGIFDTSFGGHETLLEAKDVYLFLGGIVNLLEIYPDIAVVLKRKWIWAEFVEVFPDVETIYREIHNHPRCLSIGDSERDPADVIAISDLIISMCFTSATIEALGAKKKAIYFDGANRLRGYFYDDFPNLVAHGTQELKKLINHWFNISDEDFNSYLDKYIKGEIDSFVDGKAITRFRQELCKED